MKQSFCRASVFAFGLIATLGFVSTTQAGPFIRVDFGNGSVQFGTPRYPLSYRPAGYPYRTPYTSRYQTVAPIATVPPVSPVAPVGPGYGPGIPGGVVRDQHYHVMVRRCHRDPWQEYGEYNCHESAHRVQERLIRRGYQARVVHHD